MDWCNSNVVASSIMEAVSFVTPAIERFLVGTAADALQAGAGVGFALQGARFIREESRHSAAHQAFNTILLGHLRRPPPGVGLVQLFLRMAPDYLKLTTRLLLLGALEHMTAVCSAHYLTEEARWRFDSPQARHLFAWHAREEIDHASLAMELCASGGPASRWVRWLAMTSLLGAGALYLMLSVPWIACCKAGGSVARTAGLLWRFGWKAAVHPGIRRGIVQVFEFAGRDFPETHRRDADT
jgi:predicted metal-dependent hydrolase